MHGNHFCFTTQHPSPTHASFLMPSCHFAHGSYSSQLSPTQCQGSFLAQLSPHRTRHGRLTSCLYLPLSLLLQSPSTRTSGSTRRPPLASSASQRTPSAAAVPPPSPAP